MKTIEKAIRLCTVLKKKKNWWWLWRYAHITGIIHEYFQRNYLSISRFTWKMAISSKLELKIFFFNTVHNLIYFSMVFITKVHLPLIITKVNSLFSGLILKIKKNYFYVRCKYPKLNSLLYNCSYKILTLYIFIPGGLWLQVCVLTMNILVLK